MLPSIRLPALLLFLAANALAAPIEPLPYKVDAKLGDVVAPVEPSAVHIDGWLGHRIDVNVSQRLLAIDTRPLLAGFQHRPGEHPWIGEHIGKWLHAATLAWAYTSDPALRAKLDGAVRELLVTQEPDGYLGTYAPGQRFGLYPNADWDVWVHKYDLIGLLTYYRYTGDTASLAAARKIGDLLIATFPTKSSILAAGTHVGMAATSVLEPIVQLYRVTGDERYLAFARYIVRAYDEPGGPAIVKSLLTVKRVDLTANGKAYEMLSNLVGLCELARVTGDRALLDSVTNAWTDIVRNRLYLTGTASTHEHFGADHELPNGADADVGETCVTTTWLQLNLELLRLTGRVEHADEIERALYNHLTAAQNPRGDDWCYFTPLEGAKRYDTGITCCHSSGPRGLALAPTVAYLQSDDAVLVSTFESSRARFIVHGKPVEIVQQSGFPLVGRSTLTIHAAESVRFVLKIRVPSWAAPLHAGTVAAESGWATLADRTWSDGDHVDFVFNLQGRVIRGEFTNFARSAMAWGPFVLAVDQSANPGLNSLEGLRLPSDASVTLVRDAQGLLFESAARSPWDDTPRSIKLVPFAEAGATGSVYRIWLRSL
jgi:DUF1680 family protein